MGERNSIRKLSVFFLTLAATVFMLGSCISSQIVSKTSTGRGVTLSGEGRFFLEKVQVTSFGFLEQKDIRYILDKKLRFAFGQLEQVRLAETRRTADYLIVPELIVKQYRKNYQERFYYQLHVTILSRENGDSRLSETPRAAESVRLQEAHQPWEAFRACYEYSGSASIFDVKVQDAMIEKLIKDFTRQISM